MTITEKCQSIVLLLSDVDGVMSDGRLIYDNRGIETKSFHARDGLGIKLWQRAGHRFGMVTKRSSQIVKNRAGELGVDLVRQGVEDKAAALREIAEQLALSPEQIAYIGDDFPDLPAMRLAGVGITVPGASREILQASDLVTQTPGGRGAVREVIELILRQQHRWEPVIQSYQA